MPLCESRLTLYPEQLSAQEGIALLQWKCHTCSDSYLLSQNLLDLAFSTEEIRQPLEVWQCIDPVRKQYMVLFSTSYIMYRKIGKSSESSNKMIKGLGK